MLNPPVSLWVPAIEWLALGAIAAATAAAMAPRPLLPIALYAAFTLVCGVAVFPVVGSHRRSETMRQAPFRLRLLLLEVTAFAAGTAALATLFRFVSDSLGWGFDLGVVFGGVVGGFFSGLGAALAARALKT